MHDFGWDINDSPQKKPGWSLGAWLAWHLGHQETIQVILSVPRRCIRPHLIVKVRLVTPSFTTVADWKNGATFPARFEAQHLLMKYPISPQFSDGELPAIMDHELTSPLSLVRLEARLHWWSTLATFLQIVSWSSTLYIGRCNPGSPCHATVLRVVPQAKICYSRIDFGRHNGKLQKNTQHFFTSSDFAGVPIKWNGNVEIWSWMIDSPRRPNTSIVLPIGLYIRLRNLNLDHVEKIIHHRKGIEYIDWTHMNTLSIQRLQRNFNLVCLLRRWQWQVAEWHLVRNHELPHHSYQLNFIV